MTMQTLELTRFALSAMATRESTNDRPWHIATLSCAAPIGSLLEA
jgi:hypothetical protein